jgi:hypothetical protein
LEDNNRNWFVRLLIVTFCLFLGSMVVYRFFYTDPKAEISGGLLVLLAFVLVLVLSELFDNFSVGKLVMMSKSLKEKEVQASELKKENVELRNHLISISTSVSQRQTSTNIFGLPDNFVDALTVRQAAHDEVEEKKKEDDPLSSSQTLGCLSSNKFNQDKRTEQAISHFVSQQNLQSFNLIREAKLSTQFSGIDPISDTTPIFDGYINAVDSEVFIETRPLRYASFLFRDRLYVMLSKIHHYKSIKKTNIYLALLVLTRLHEEANYRNDEYYLEKLQREFEPAITSGLLRIYTINITQEELQIDH